MMTEMKTTHLKKTKYNISNFSPKAENQYSKISKQLLMTYTKDGEAK